MFERAHNDQKYQERLQKDHDGQVNHLANEVAHNLRFHHANKASQELNYDGKHLSRSDFNKEVSTVQSKVHDKNLSVMRDKHGNVVSLDFGNDHIYGKQSAYEKESAKQLSQQSGTRPEAEAQEQKQPPRAEHHNGREGKSEEHHYRNKSAERQQSKSGEQQESKSGKQQESKSAEQREGSQSKKQPENDSSGKVVTRTGPDGVKEETSTYPSGTTKVVDTQPDGSSKTEVKTKEGALIYSKEIGTDGSKSETWIQSDGVIKTHEDPNSHTRTQEFDAKDKSRSCKNTYTYDPNTGETMSYQHENADGSGSKVWRQSGPEGYVYEHHWDANGQNPSVERRLSQPTLEQGYKVQSVVRDGKRMYYKQGDNTNGTPLFETADTPLALFAAQKKLSELRDNREI